MGKKTGAQRVSLSGPDDDSDLVALFIKWPAELEEYVRATMKAHGKTKTSVIQTAVRLDRDLADLLKGEQAALHAYADKQALKMNKDLAKILALLVKQGLHGTGKKD